MSEAIAVLDYYINEFKISNNTIEDFDFSNFSFLEEEEPSYDIKGHKIDKYWYAPNGRPAIRMVYGRRVESHTFDGQTVVDVFKGYKNKIEYLDWNGDVKRTKYKKPYRFKLSPVYAGDGNSTLIGFSSIKQRKELKNERYAADDYLQSKNPQLYAFIYYWYTVQYEGYLRTGDKSGLVTAITNETDTAILSVLDMEVADMDGVTVKQLILTNLQ